MKLAAIGSNCVDFYVNINGGEAFPGGGPVNMAVYTARLGESSSYIGPVGNDKNGEIILNSLEKEKVDISHVRIEEGNTAVTEVSLENGERIFGDYHEGVMIDYSLSDADIDFIATHDFVVADFWGRAEQYLPILHKRGIKIAFDCANRLNDDICTAVIPYVDYLFFSSDFGDNENLRDQMRKIHHKGSGIVIAMLGEKGSLSYDGSKFIKFGIIPCDNVVDTMGAGDSYIAGFLCGIDKYGNISLAMENGAKTATKTISYFGAW
ncbi:fructoselysine 6-kinase [Vagococcus elongatus]|uniref:Fructoselysine 6-kinase n=1 Tax=Vagococcus elongatus TaxID=180344 RepID=A0A430API1_9ENTE|nr:fructoselysine 6-kinase [Vagococcus elongatus]RSU09975.1 fructoselysine 6-kinase [Vagococcus elongatus]